MLHHRTSLLFLTMLATYLATGFGAQSTPTSGPWKLTWSDEFNASSGSSLDLSKWTAVSGGGGWGNDELEYYTPRAENIRQENGNLVIEARQESFTGDDHVTRQYTSARIKSQGKFTQKYGRFEARMKLPLGKGLWPAFWLLGDDHETAKWPNCGELDIMENIGDAHRIFGTLHGPSLSKASSAAQVRFDLPGNETVDNEFHVYAVEWEPGVIRFYVDDHLYGTVTKESLPKDAVWVYDHPFYILLNLAVGGGWPGSPDQTTKLPQQMLVDYVRVYQR